MIWAGGAATPAAIALTALAAAIGVAAPAGADPWEKPAGAFRVATFNVSLARKEEGALIDELRRPAAARARPQIAALLSILRRLRPDAIALLELDHDPAGEALDLFAAALAEPDAASPGLAYAHRFTAPVNAGVPTGFDLDGDGKDYGPGDAQGWGLFEGQFGMAILSHAPIDAAATRTFQRFLWRDLPGAAPPLKADGAPFYPPEAWAILRLSSKSHWDAPILLPDGRRLHLLISHPTPPVFDGPEDRNGLRNAAEIDFWRAYLDEAEADWLKDDQGRPGGLAPDASFVVMGDLNADPADGDGRRDAVAALLAHPRLVDPAPISAGAAAAAARQGGENARHRGPPERDTADWKDEGARAPGNLRVDYLLPSRDLTALGAGTFWPDPDAAPALAEAAAAASDHRLLWIDLALAP